MEKLKLYSYFQSSAAYRVRIALNFKNLGYEYCAVDLTKGQQNDMAYEDINPMAEVPSLEFEGQRIAQSVAIFLWLDKKFSKSLLFPEEATAFAHVLQFCENINSGIHPIQNLKVRQELEKRFGATVEVREKWCAYWIERGFRSIEKVLQKTSGVYCFGDSITAADMFLVPQVYNARRYKLDMTQFPLIDKIDRALESQEAFKKAHPSQQPDAR